LRRSPTPTDQLQLTTNSDTLRDVRYGSVATGKPMGLPGAHRSCCLSLPLGRPRGRQPQRRPRPRSPTRPCRQRRPPCTVTSPSRARQVQLTRRDVVATRLLARLAAVLAQASTPAEGWGAVHAVLPTSPRESRFSLAYSHPYKRHPMTWRQSCRSRPHCTRNTNWTN
jgi:hypothetical protein